MGNVGNVIAQARHRLIFGSDFAEAYPNTAIIGTDLSPIQPDTTPPNLSFEIDDCCSEWVYPKNHFDFIHIRALYGSVADWPKFYRECLEYVCARSSIMDARIANIVDHATAISPLAVTSSKQR